MTGEECSANLGALVICRPGIYCGEDGFNKNLEEQQASKTSQQRTLLFYFSCKSQDRPSCQSIAVSLVARPSSCLILIESVANLGLCKQHSHDSAKINPVPVVLQKNI